MFTLEQIQKAHSKVKSGADFPEYLQEIKKLGVIQYETFIFDGHTNYWGVDSFCITSPALYKTQVIQAALNINQFKADLKAHQQGQTDFLTFCNHCAQAGVEKWIVRMDHSTCMYYDQTGDEILVENIPLEPGK